MNLEDYLDSLSEKATPGPCGTDCPLPLHWEHCRQIGAWNALRGARDDSAEAVAEVLRAARALEEHIDSVSKANPDWLTFDMADKALALHAALANADRHVPEEKE